MSEHTAPSDAERIQELEAWQARAREALNAMDVAIREGLRAWPRIADRATFVRECVRLHREDAVRSASALPTLEYGELPAELRGLIIWHEWDNMTHAEQRQWLIDMFASAVRANARDVAVIGMERLAGEVASAVDQQFIDARSCASDALLDYAAARYGNRDPIGDVRRAFNRLPEKLRRSRTI